MKLDTQKRVAANLRILRTCKNVSQSQIADMVGISRSLYTHYELGRRTPDAEVLYKIANRFGIEMGMLFEVDPQMFINHMKKSQFCDDDLMELTAFYRKLSPFAKGMLMERAMYLLDWDRFREDSQRALDERKEAFKAMGQDCEDFEDDLDL